MALLTDGNPNDTEALRVFETAILDVAKWRRSTWTRSSVWPPWRFLRKCWTCLLGHTRTQYSLTTSVDGDRRKIGVSDVVVSPQMKRWHALHTLAVVYRDAYNNQLNDRYQNKWEEYRELARGAKERTLEFGIGLVADAGAAGRNAGTGGGGRDSGRDDLLRAGELGIGGGSRGKRESCNHFSDRGQQWVNGRAGECAGGRGGMECVSGADDFDADAAE